VSKDNKKIIFEAIRNDDISALLRGEKYVLEFPPMFPADLPNYWYDILDKGIYPGYISDNNSIDSKFKQTLLDIADDNLGVYTALCVLMIHLDREQDNRSPFILDKEELIDRISEYLCNNKEKLVKDRRWGGALCEDGLWEELVRICDIIKEDYDIDIIHP
jgi:hypothetical protein